MKNNICFVFVYMINQKIKCEEYVLDRIFISIFKNVNKIMIGFLLKIKEL